MKTFFAVFAAILCSAALIIGYLDQSVRLEHWQQENAAIRAQVAVFYNQWESFDPDREDHVQDRKDCEGLYRIKQALLATSLEKKPWFLSGQEKRELARINSEIAIFARNNP